MKVLKKFIPIIIILLFSFWPVKSFFNNGFFPMHDDTQVARVFEMHKALNDGMFPVRWVTDLGYNFGYPIFNFYAPLAYYIGGIFMFFGVNALFATKFMMILGIILSGVFMYLFAKEFWGEIGGIVSAILYLYAPYHALDIYVRGDVSEFFAYAFIPLAFFGIYKTFNTSKYFANTNLEKSKNKKTKSSIWNWIIVASVAYGFIILSHNLTAMMVTPFIFIFTFLLYISLRTEDKIYRPYFVFFGLLLGIALSAFYWLPVFPELKYTNVLSVTGGGSNYKDHFVCFRQLWDSPWGYGGSVPGCIDGLSFRIGKLHIILSLFSIACLSLIFKKDKSKFAVVLFSIISLLLSIFLTLSQSKFIWDAIPHMAFFQFPWRFLVLVSFFISFLGGAVFYSLENMKLKILNKYIYFAISAVLIIVIVYFNAKVFVPQKILNKSSAYYTSRSALSWTVSKISDEYMPKDFLKPLYEKGVPEKKVTGNKNIKILSSLEKTQHISFVANAKDKSNLLISLAYFPGWHVFVDNNQVLFKYFNEGVLINVPKGKNTIDIKFSQTPIEILGDLITLTGVVVLLLGIII